MCDKWKKVCFDKASISKLVLHSPGVYKILQSSLYNRYHKTTRILKIGMSKKSLRKELLNHFGPHTASNRLCRIKSDSNNRITIRWYHCGKLKAKNLNKSFSKNLKIFIGICLS